MRHERYGFIRAAQEMQWRGGTEGIFLAGPSRPIAADRAEAFDDEAKRIGIAKADANQFTLQALMSVAFIRIGIALGLWPRAMTHFRAPTSRHNRRSAGSFRRTSPNRRAHGKRVQGEPRGGEV